MENYEKQRAEEDVKQSKATNGDDPRCVVMSTLGDDYEAAGSSLALVLEWDSDAMTARVWLH